MFLARVCRFEEIQCNGQNYRGVIDKNYDKMIMMLLENAEENI